MTTATAPSAYPAPIEALMPEARELAARLGETPSRNQLMKTFKIGAPKASSVRDALRDEATDTPTKPALTLVPDLEPNDPTDEPDTVPAAPMPPMAPEELPLAAGDGHPDTTSTTVEAPTAEAPNRTQRTWPVLLLALPAFVAIWSGWVGLGELTGFGTVHPLPGIWDAFRLNTAITLPIGVETYAAFALRAWLSPHVPPAARSFARWSAIGSLLLGAAGQVAYHLMTSAHVTHAPWPVTTAVACLPVAVLGMGAALAHLMHTDRP